MRIAKTDRQIRGVTDQSARIWTTYQCPLWGPKAAVACRARHFRKAPQAEMSALRGNQDDWIEDKFRVIGGWDATLPD